MKCNHCEAELEEGVTLCPECGCDNAPEAENAQDAVETTVETDETVQQSAEEAPETTEEAGEQSVEGEENTESTPIVEGKMTPGKIALLVVLAVAAIAVVIALIVGGLGGGETETEPTGASTEVSIPSNGDPTSELCKESYTASDEDVVAAGDTVVATLGDEQLTNADLQIYYYTQFFGFLDTYGSYAPYMGLDYTLPLDTQLNSDGSSSWQQFFLMSSIDAWHSYAALDMEAKKAGFEMDDSYAAELENIASDLEATAVSAGFESADEMIKSEMGAGATMDAYMKYVMQYYNGMLYYQSLVEQIEVTDADAEAYYDANAESYVESGIEKVDEDLVDVRHILIMPEGGTVDETTGMTTYTDEEWEACRVKAQEILDEYLAGEMTEERFGELAATYSEDGNASMGGIYEGVYLGQMVEPFETWCFDESRVAGDTGLVQTEYGYHVMYFVDRYVNPEPTWLATAKTDLLDEQSYAIIENAMANYELTVDYSLMKLGFVDLSVDESAETTEATEAAE